jgi:hypothetical protein
MHPQTTQETPSSEVAPIADTEHTEQVQALFDLARDMLCVARLDGSVALLNPAWEAITGHSTEFRAQFVRLRDGVPVVGLAVRFRCADRTYRWLRFSANPRAGFAYAVARDITEQYEANQRVEHYQAALRRNAAMIDASLMQATELLRQLHSLHRIVVLSLSAAAGEVDAAFDAHREATA